MGNIEFTTGQIRPFECFREGWELIKPQYWIIFGITVVGLIIAGFIPFGIALGAAYCGIYFAIFKLIRGERVEFGDLFKGLNYFVPALIAILIFIIPVFVFRIISCISIFGYFVSITSGSGQFEESAI